MITRHDLTHEHLHDALQRKKTDQASGSYIRRYSTDGKLDISTRVKRAFSFKSEQD